MMVPFAFAVGALIGKAGWAPQWIEVTRRFALAAWLCLGVGIFFGTAWSSTELGYSGVLSVESGGNAALMP